MKMLIDVEIENKYAGEEFFDRVEPLAKRLFAAKRRLLETQDVEKFTKEASILYYFHAYETHY
jgi:hypothetical protein